MGSDPASTLFESGLCATSPSFSPDGKSIALTHGEGQPRHRCRSHGRWGMVRLTRQQAANAQPSWSHDGNWIYFRSDRSGRGRSEIAGDGKRTNPTHGQGAAIRPSNRRMADWCSTPRSAATPESGVCRLAEGQRFPCSKPPGTTHGRWLKVASTTSTPTMRTHRRSR